MKLFFGLLALGSLAFADTAKEAVINIEQFAKKCEALKDGHFIEGNAKNILMNAYVCRTLKDNKLIAVYIPAQSIYLELDADSKAFFQKSTK